MTSVSASGPTSAIGLPGSPGTNSNSNHTLSNMHPGSAASPAPSSGSSPASSGGSTRPLRLRRVNHSDEIISGFGRLLKTESMCDVTLSCQGGLNLRAHRVILSTFSPYFKAIFEAPPFADTPWHYPVVVMKDYGYHELKAIIEFIYRGEVSVPRDRLAAVLHAARMLEVSGLADLKLENFGVSADSGPPPPPPLVNGHSFLSSLGKRSSPDVETIYGGNNSDPSLAKKLRITLDNDVVTSSSLNSGGYFGQTGLAGLGDTDGVRSLLQQPPRLPQVFQQLRQQQQQQQQQTLQQLALNSQKRTTVSLQQLMAQQRALQSQSGGQGRGLSTTSTTGHSRLQLQQQHIKQQILQQQLLRNGAGKTGNGFSSGTGLGGGGRGHQSLQFLQFQQRIRQQFQDKQRSRESLHDRLSGRPLLQKQLQAAKENQLEDKKPSAGGEEEQESEVEVIIKEGDEAIKETQLQSNGDEDDAGNGADGGADTADEDGKEPDLAKGDNQDQESTNGDRDNGDDQDGPDAENLKKSENGADNGDAVDDPKANGDYDDEEQSAPMALTTSGNSGNVNHDIDEDPDEDEYEILDKDLLFKQQQQLRLQQIQKQQQYQQQLQLQLEQEEQEQRLIEYHQRLAAAAGDVGDGGDDQDDNDNSFGFNWTDGFTDELPYTAQNATLNEAAAAAANQRSSAGDHHQQNGQTVLATPDFLQPRGPGRPRKGNKAQEISPCPECNKVFVRPDVLKLHYRSVHLNERHPCNLCPKIFKWPGDLSKHKRTKHPDKHPPPNQANH